MPEQEQSSHIGDHLYNEQVSLLYTGAKYRPALHFISLAIFLSVIINYVNEFHAYTWGLLLFGLNLFRFIDTLKIRNQLDKVDNYKSIHRRYAFCAGILGAIYGLGFVFFFSKLPLINQVYLLTLLAVMTPAGLVSFASDKLSFYMYFYALCLPPIIRTIIEGQVEYFNIAVCGIIYMVIVIKLFTWNYDVLTNAIRLKHENQNLVKSFKKVNERLKELSVIDELTQVANRRSLDDNLEKEWLRAKRTSSPISVLMLDIDYFKQYNDEFGHLKGDECLKSIADYLKNNLYRPGDFIARYGGEEFCIIMPNTNLEGAEKFAKKIHIGIRELKIENPGSKVSKYITVSIGVASVFPLSDESYMDLIFTSDKALYDAKHDGRNIIRTKNILEKNLKPRLVS